MTFAFALIEGGKILQRVVEPDQVNLFLYRDEEHLVERSVSAGELPFFRSSPPRVIDQDAAHDARSDREKVSPVLPLRFVLAAEADIGFMNQRGSLQGMSLAFAPQMVMRQTTQLLIYDRRKLFQRAGISPVPLPQQA
jgi:hypothetical protein